MLVDFSVKNFKSFNDKQTLSMLSTNIPELKNNIFQLNKNSKLSLLKSAIIYGGNGSGKTNLLDAIYNLKMLILNSTDIKVDKIIPYYKPFKLENNSKKLPTEYEIEFIGYDNIRYKYCVSFNKYEVLKESLFFYPSQQEAKLFIREKGKSIDFGAYLKGDKKSIESQLLNNNLFLSKAANSNNAQLTDVYIYFRNNLWFSDQTKVDSSTFYTPYTTKRIANTSNDNFKNNVRDLLYFADTDIDNLDIKITKPDNIELPDDMPDFIKKEILDRMTYTPITFHRLYENKKEVGFTEFNLSEESDGTQKIYSLGGKVLDVLEKGNVFIVDELNNSFHPLISQFLIQLFNNPKNNPKNAQLIFATHDTSLLSAKIFRRDQIWFTEKNQYGSTNLYSLCEFDYKTVRANIPFERWYLSGRFGGLPLLKEFNFNA